MLNKQTVYIETSIVSYLTARPSRDVVSAGRQQITIDWWNEILPKYKCVISPAVIQEASLGHPEASHRRLTALKDIDLILLTDDIINLQQILLEQGALPQKADLDALHIAFATIHKIDYLLTWNCKHIANAHTRPIIEKICYENCQHFPILCTPNELMD